MARMNGRCQMTSPMPGLTWMTAVRWVADWSHCLPRERLRYARSRCICRLESGQQALDFANAHGSCSISLCRRTASRCGRPRRAMPRKLLVVRPGDRGRLRGPRHARSAGAAAAAAMPSSSTTPRFFPRNLHGRRIGRGEHEPAIAATLIKRLDGSRWQALVKPAKRLGARRRRALRQRRPRLFPRTARRHGRAKRRGRAAR